MVAQGVPVRDAYQRAGYKGGDVARTELRRDPDIDARVKWLLMHRVETDTQARHAREKKTVDRRERWFKEIEKLAYSDVRDVVQWERVPIIDAEGNVTGYEDAMTATPSRKLSPRQAGAIKGVTTKSGALKIDMHDKAQALDKLGKALGIFSDSTPALPSVTVNQLNVGDVSALEAARRMAYLLASAGRLEAPQAMTIEGEVSDEPEKTAKPETGNKA